MSMPTYPSATPAYGRDYKSKKEVLDAWKAGKDFMLRTLSGDALFSIRDVESLKEEGVKAVNIRYRQQRQVCPIKL